MRAREAKSKGIAARLEDCVPANNFLSRQLKGAAET
jgi:hypothetical protein